MLSFPTFFFCSLLFQFEFDFYFNSIRIYFYELFRFISHTSAHLISSHQYREFVYGEKRLCIEWRKKNPHAFLSFECIKLQIQQAMPNRQPITHIYSFYSYRNENEQMNANRKRFDQREYTVNSDYFRMKTNDRMKCKIFYNSSKSNHWLDVSTLHTLFAALLQLNTPFLCYNILCISLRELFSLIRSMIVVCLFRAHLVSRILKRV